METVTDQRLSPMRSATKSFTNAPDRTVPRRTGRASGSTARWPPNEPPPRPTGPRPTVPAPTRTGCITTITTDPTPAAAERHPSSATCSQPAREEQLDRSDAAQRGNLHVDHHWAVEGSMPRGTVSIETPTPLCDRKLGARTSSD